MEFNPPSLHNTQLLHTLLLTDYLLKFFTTGREVRGRFPFEQRSLKSRWFMLDTPRCSTCRDWLWPCIPCQERHKASLARAMPPKAPRFVYKKRPDGTFLVGLAGDIDNNHWHLASDGTVLSVKEGGNHLFRRTDVTRDIRTVCPELDISFLWNG